MILGVDFDNTIASYDRVFYDCALNLGLIPPMKNPSKTDVRNQLRWIGKEDEWIKLQGFVYGKCMQDVVPYPGSVTFFQYCHTHGIPVFIVSHKTRYPYCGECYDLHASATEWIMNQGILRNPDTISEGVFFELTKENKIERIRKLGCTHFIDDLPEFLSEPEFPSEVCRILFDPHDLYTDTGTDFRMQSWSELLEWVSGSQDSLHDK